MRKIIFNNKEKIHMTKEILAIAALSFSPILLVLLGIDIESKAFQLGMVLWTVFILFLLFQRGCLLCSDEQYYELIKRNDMVIYKMDIFVSEKINVLNVLKNEKLTNEEWDALEKKIGSELNGLVRMYWGKGKVILEDITIPISTIEKIV